MYIIFVDIINSPLNIVHKVHKIILFLQTVDVQLFCMHRGKIKTV